MWQKRVCWLLLKDDETQPSVSSVKSWDTWWWPFEKFSWYGWWARWQRLQTFFWKESLAEPGLNWVKLKSLSAQLQKAKTDKCGGKTLAMMIGGWFNQTIQQCELIQLLKLQNKSVPQWDGTWAETFCAKKKTKRGQKYFDYEDLTAGKRWLNPTRREQGKNQSGFSLQVPHLSFSNCIWRQHLNVSTLHATSSEEDEFSLVAAVAGYEEMADRGRRCSFQTLFFQLNFPPALSTAAAATGPVFKT